MSVTRSWLLGKLISQGRLTLVLANATISVTFSVFFGEVEVGLVELRGNEDDDDEEDDKSAYEKKERIEMMSSSSAN